MQLLLDKYEVRAVLREGPVSVYAAKEGQSRFAVRVIRDDAMREFAERIRDDKAALLRYEHDHGARIVEIAEQDNAIYIVSDFIEGTTLAHFLIKRGRFSLDEGVRLASQVISAVAHAHQMNLVHGDISTHNVILEQSENGVLNAKLISFGIAKSANYVLANPQLAKNGTVTGSACSIAPEVILGARADKPSDVYACGILLLEMLLEQAVFRTERVDEMLARHLRAPVRMPKRLMESPLGEFINRAINKRPEDRFLDGAVMARVLENTGFESFKVRSDQIPLPNVQSFLGPHGVFSPGEQLRLIPPIPYVAQNETVRVELSGDQQAEIKALRSEANKYRVQTRKLEAGNESIAKPPPDANQETVMVVLPEAQRKMLEQAGDFLNETAELKILSESFKQEPEAQAKESGRRIERDILFVIILVLVALSVWFFVFHERPIKTGPTEPVYEKI